MNTNSYITQKSDLSGSFTKSQNKYNNSKTLGQNDISEDKTIYELNIALVGNSGVGKTTLIRAFTEQDLDKDIKCTIDVECKTKNLTINANSSVKLTIWDTAGQEKYFSMTNSIFQKAHGIILVYDVTDIKSFDSLDRWMKKIKDIAPINSSILLVGNKIDLEKKISTEQGTEYALKNNIQFAEVSSIEKTFIETPFQNISLEIIKKIENNEIIAEESHKDDNNILIKENGIKLNDNQKIENEMDLISKKEKKREKEVTCC